MYCQTSALTVSWTARMARDSAIIPKLTDSEISEVAGVAEHQRNAQNCKNGWDDCNRSKLTPLEAGQTAVADHQRNLSECRNGQETCDYSKTDGDRNQDVD